MLQRLHYAVHLQILTWASVKVQTLFSQKFTHLCKNAGTFLYFFSFCVNNLSSLMISGCLGLMLTDRQIWTAGRPVKHKYQDLAFGTCAGQGLELSFSWTISEPENWGIIMPEWIWYILGVRWGWVSGWYSLRKFFYCISLWSTLPHHLRLGSRNPPFKSLIKTHPDISTCLLVFL